jgi:hypothetical protein
MVGSGLTWEGERVGKADRKSSGPFVIESLKVSSHGHCVYTIVSGEVREELRLHSPGFLRILTASPESPLTISPSCLETTLPESSNCTAVSSNFGSEV